jgi:hypothetical protein
MRPPLKKLTTKIAKQYGGYCLIKGDLEFCIHVFTRAAELAPQRTPTQSGEDSGGFAERVKLAEPLLRAGGVLDFEQNNIDTPEQDRRAFFEAGIVTYAKCFNASMRTRLSEDIFRGSLHGQRALHKWMMETRNHHIAHSELRLEKSYAGIVLVDLPNYGRRGVLMAIMARRNAPRKDKLLEMAAHCSAIIKEYLSPQIAKTNSEIRKHYLRLTKEQYNALPDYFDVVNPIELPDEHIWVDPSNGGNLE